MRHAQRSAKAIRLRLYESGLSRVPTHWTYEPDPSPDSDLEQGDIILPNEALTDLFVRVHPHFCESKYVGFLVLTQSCDLVVRGNKCSARYVSLGVIRQLEDVLSALLETICDPLLGNVYLSESKLDAKKFLGRLFNQNESTLGLFYLHDDADIGLGRSCVAILRVAISLRSDHYDIVRSARKGRLKPEFRNRLGWLIGNIYSRVAAPDWSEQPGGNAKILEMTDQLLADNCSWISRANVEEAKRAGVDITAINKDELIETLRKHQPKPLKDEVLDCVARILQSVLPEDSAPQISKAIGRLRNDSQLAQTLRSAKST